MSTKKAAIQKQTRQFLQKLNGGQLTFGQLLTAIREAEEVSLATFAERLDISRQHLHQIENGAKGVSPERALQFARTLKHSELLFVKLALQDLVDEAGLKATVELKTAS